MQRRCRKKRWHPDTRYKDTGGAGTHTGRLHHTIFTRRGRVVLHCALPRHDPLPRCPLRSTPKAMPPPSQVSNPFGPPTDTNPFGPKAAPPPPSAAAQAGEKIFGGISSGFSALSRSMDSLPKAPPPPEDGESPPKMSTTRMLKLAAEEAMKEQQKQLQQPQQPQQQPTPTDVPEIAFLEGLVTRMQRCEKEGQLELAVSIYRTALPVFASADTAARAISKAHGQEVSGPILRKIQTVSRLASPSPNPAPTPASSPSPPRTAQYPWQAREESTAFLTTASMRIKAELEKGTGKAKLKSKALDEAVKRAALIDAALRDTPPPPPPPPPTEFSFLTGVVPRLQRCVHEEQIDLAVRCLSLRAADGR